MIQKFSIDRQSVPNTDIQETDIMAMGLGLAGIDISLNAGSYWY